MTRAIGRRGTAPLAIGVPHGQAIWKSRRHFIAKEHLPLELTDRALRPCQSEVERRPQLRRCGRAPDVNGLTAEDRGGVSEADAGDEREDDGRDASWAFFLGPLARALERPGVSRWINTAGAIDAVPTYVLLPALIAL